MKKIAIIGIRGIPIVYSGFETLAEQLAPGLIKKNFSVTIYCRNDYFKNKKKFYKKIRLIYIPTVKGKNTETFFHSLFSTVHACFFCHYDIILYLGVGSTLFSFWPRLFGTKTIVNVDGLDWRREKWGLIAKKYLQISEFLATKLPNKFITDSLFIQRYYQNKWGQKTEYIPYGSFTGRYEKTTIIKKLKLNKNRYFVWVGRLVPDNHLEELITVFNKIKTNFKCVIIGDDFFDSQYKRNILKLIEKNKKIIWTGFLDRNDYATIVKNSFAYVETKRSGGTHPSLVEAMGLCGLIISNNHPANKEVIGSEAYYYDPSAYKRELIDIFREIKKTPQFTLNLLRKKTKNKAKKFYTWKEVIKKYQELFYSI